ncbi:MAG TPA: XRE family transcriptional regulator [Actinomycetes bacterium]|nr:XRE family transcriptional regulator [Actinomycetes bacterium]
MNTWYSLLYFTILNLSTSLLLQRSGEDAVPEPQDVNAAVGRNVRAQRTSLAWTLDDLAARSGVSKGMLSQVEQARTNPSVATICRLATALGVSIASLVEAPEGPSARVVRAEEAVTLWTGGHQDSWARLLVGSGTSQQVELWDVRMVAGDGYASEGHPSGTRELLLVIDGELTLELDGDPHQVGAGDAIAFVADRPHAYRNRGSAPLRYSLSVIHRDQPSRPVPMPPT